MRALVIHHDRNSALGHLGLLLAQRGIDVHEHYVCHDVGSPEATEPYPELGDEDLVIALGSRWSVYDEESIGSWIHDELALLRDAQQRGIGVLGICFGGQALAAALGGRVKPGPYPDIGWSLIDSEEPEIVSGPWFQWHFDVFEVPPDATTLAASPTGPQAFRIGRSLGLQFHPELDPALLALWLVDDHHQLIDSGIDPDEVIAETAQRADEACAQAGRLLDWYLGEVLPS